MSDERADYTREHLLFASLYQARDPKRPNSPVDTPCTFIVPERGQLVVSIGYRRPIVVIRGATMRAEIWIADRDSSVPLFSEVIAIRPQKGWRSPAAQNIASTS